MAGEFSVDRVEEQSRSQRLANVSTSLALLLSNVSGLQQFANDGGVQSVSQGGVKVLAQCCPLRPENALLASRVQEKLACILLLPNCVALKAPTESSTEPNSAGKLATADVIKCGNEVSPAGTVVLAIPRNSCTLEAKTAGVISRWPTPVPVAGIGVTARVSVAKGTVGDSYS